MKKILLSVVIMGLCGMLHGMDYDQQKLSEQILQHAVQCNIVRKAEWALQARQGSISPEKQWFKDVASQAQSEEMKKLFESYTCEA